MRLYIFRVCLKERSVCVGEKGRPGYQIQVPSGLS